MQAVIQEISKGLSYSYGDDFFKKITMALDKVIKSDYTFIARLNTERMVSQTVSLVSHGKVLDNFEYALEHTPCQDVANDSVCIYPNEVCSAFPLDQLLIDMKIQGYLGTPLHSSSGEVMGLIVALYENPIEDEEFTLSLFDLFAGRIAGEFERQDHELQLIELNQHLDRKVEERTKELQSTVVKLKKAHEQLIESEKMAALGGLVAGVAHEVNTPLGVAITAESLLEEKYLKFKEKLDGVGISMNDMNSFMSQLSQSLPLLANNLSRAKELIEDFKKTAKEQTDIKEESIVIEHYYQRVISTLTPILKQKNATINFTGCEGAAVTYPGYHAQILTNLVTNSVEHGFSENSEKNIITIDIEKVSHEEFKVTYKDSGRGISEENISRVVEPFYTTARGSGSTGLGLSICHNLSTKPLKGSFTLHKCNTGTHIEFTFKTLA